METDLVGEVVKLVFSILGPIIAAAVVAVLVQLLRKLGIELDASKQVKVEAALGNAVALTEEWASTQIKRGIPVTAADKATHYLSLAADKVPGVSPEEATDVARVILGRFRVAAAASVSDIRTAATGQ